MAARRVGCRKGHARLAGDPGLYRAVQGRPAGRLVREFRDRLLGLGEERAEVWGRPAALAVAKDGSLLVTADTGGTIWRISYKGPPPAEHAAVRAEEAGSAAQGQAALNWQGRIAFAAHLADERPLARRYYSS
jgi:hypothetical protein